MNAADLVTGNLGEALRAVRAARKQTARQVAEQIGVSASTVRRIESGHAVDGRTLVLLLRWLMGDGAGVSRANSSCSRGGVTEADQQLDLLRSCG